MMAMGMAIYANQYGDGCQDGDGCQCQVALLREHTKTINVSP